jgi:hypothetical protein
LAGVGLAIFVGQAFYVVFPCIMHPPLFGQEKKNVHSAWLALERSHKQERWRETDKGKKENKTRDAFSNNDPSAMQQQQHNWRLDARVAFVYAI